MQEIDELQITEVGPILVVPKKSINLLRVWANGLGRQSYEGRPLIISCSVS